jgi:hypothetical protein
MGKNNRRGLHRASVYKTVCKTADIGIGGVQQLASISMAMFDSLAKPLFIGLV